MEDSSNLGQRPRRDTKMQANAYSRYFYLFFYFFVSSLGSSSVYILTVCVPAVHFLLKAMSALESLFMKL